MAKETKKQVNTAKAPIRVELVSLVIANDQAMKIDQEHDAGVHQRNDQLRDVRKPSSQPSQPDRENQHADDHDDRKQGTGQADPPATAAIKPNPDVLGFAIEVRHQHQPQHDDRWNAQSAHERRIADQFLQAQKIPGSLGGILRHRGIGHLFQRGIEKVPQGQHHR